MDVDTNTITQYSKSIQLGEKVELIAKTPETVVMSDRLHVDYFWGKSYSVV